MPSITKHLDHIEDMVFLYGTRGVKVAIEFVEDLIKTATRTGGTSEITEKIDGAPSLVIGSIGGRVFATTKSRFEAKNQRLYFTDEDIINDDDEEFTIDSGVGLVISDVLEVLTPIWNLSDDSAIQADFLFSQNNPPELSHKTLSFMPNTIKYTLNSKDGAYSSALDARIGLAVHSVFRITQDQERVTDVEGGSFNGSSRTFSIKQLDSLEDVFAVSTSYTEDMYKSLYKHKNKFVNIKNKIDDVKKLYSELKFHPVLSDWDSVTHNSGSYVTKKYACSFINSVVKEDTSYCFLEENVESTFVRKFIEEFEEYILAKIRQESPGDKSMRKYHLHWKWIADDKKTFEKMIRIFFKLMRIKESVISVFKKMPRILGKTTVTVDGEEVETGTEGHVQTLGGQKVKYVDRLEYSRKNFNQGKFNKKLEESFTPSTKKITTFQDLIEHQTMELLNKSKGDLDKAVELGNNGVVFVFGRFNPPTTGHDELLNYSYNVAQEKNCDFVVYPSTSCQRQKDSFGYFKDPLPFDYKCKILRQAYPDYNIADTTELGSNPNPYKALYHLKDKGYKRIYLVSGGDRVNKFDTMINDFRSNVQEELMIEVVNSGERNTVSSSLMREYARDGYLDDFKNRLPERLRENYQEIMEYVVEGMGGGNMDDEVKKLKVQVEIEQRSKELAEEYGVPQDEVFDIMLDILN